jgi:CelD/BcsL family acetyltransferase involved in cellulose biosynthesis
VLQSLTNVESFRFDFLSQPECPEVHERLWRGLYEAGHWDIIRLDLLPEGSPTLTAGLKVARQLGWRPFVDGTYVSPWRALGPSSASWDEGLTRKFKANLRNRERRISALGDVTFEVVNGGGTPRSALQVFYDLEASGWKAEGGTAIVQRPSAKAFYDRLVDRAAEHIWLPILRVGGNPAAAQLVRVAGRTMFMLKTAYHPDFSLYAPGQLLTARLIHYGIANGMDALDFLGENMTWKEDWTPRLRRHYQLLLFSPSLIGRYAYWMRYGLRERARRVPGMRRLVRWLRPRRGDTD